jgi:hypothetical protein
MEPPRARTELAMNNQLAVHFRTYFQKKAVEAAAWQAHLAGVISDLPWAMLWFSARPSATGG